MDQSLVLEEIEGLYRSGFPRFVRVASAVTGDRELAVEAVQEGFADSLRHAGQFAGRGRLEGWVWRCVLNRARKLRARPLAAAEVAAEGDVRERSDDAALRARLALLPERQRLVVFLRYYADLEYREIAAALGVEVGTVSATLNAAHAALRASLIEVQA